MKQIAYTIDYNGDDGRGPTDIRFASFSEAYRDTYWEDLKPTNRGYYSKSERIVDVDKIKRNALDKLDGLDKLVLGLSPAVNSKQ